MSETLLSSSPKKTYLEALLTPSTTPYTTPNNSVPNSPQFSSCESILTNKNRTDLGIIHSRLKWGLNKKNPDSLCNKCKLGIEEYEWNSYYTVYVYRFTDEYNKYKIKIFNDMDNSLRINEVFCTRCKEDIINQFKKDRLINEQKKEALISIPPLVLE
jgi:hypothetical protein